MKRAWLWAVAMLVIGGPPAYAQVEAPKAEPKPDSAADIALLEGVIKAKARDKASAEEVAKAHARIVQLLLVKGNSKGVAATRERLVEWFDAQGHPRDGGPLATLAAEARYQLLVPALEHQLAGKLVVDGKAVADARKSLELWHDAVVGPLKLVGAQSKDGKDSKDAKDFKAVKGKPLIEQLVGVQAYNAVHWSRLSALQAGRLAMAISRESAALGALEPPELQAELVELSKRLRDLAAEIWERTWKVADTAGQRDGVANDIRKELAVIKPAEYPAMDKEQQETLTPQQREASRLAALAQQTDKVQLRVLYLRKAAILDPGNPQLKELLRVAEAEYDAAQKAPH